MDDDLVQINLETITLGEVAAAEMASGLDASALVGTKTYRLLLGVFVNDLRTRDVRASESSARPRSWHELTSRRLIDASHSISPSRPDGPSPTSSD